MKSKNKQKIHNKIINKLHFYFNSDKLFFKFKKLFLEIYYYLFFSVNSLKRVTFLQENIKLNIFEFFYTEVHLKRYKT